MVRVSLIAAVLCFACGDNRTPPLPPVEVQLGEFLVQLDRRPARLSIEHGGALLFDGLPGAKVEPDEQAPPVAFAVRRAEGSYEELFGSYKILEQFMPEPWSVAREITAIEVSGQGVSFALIASGDEILARGAVELSNEGTIALRIEAEAEQNRISVGLACAEDEHFLGFGGQSFDVDHRGQSVPIWVQEDGIQKSETDDFNWGSWFLNGRRHSTHTPMPMYVSSRGYGVILDSVYRSVFSMCSEREDVVRIELWDGSFELTLVPGGSPLKVIEGMTEWVGRPEVPPAFAFAPWLDAVHGEDNVRRIAEKLRSRHVPSSVVWSEDWRGGNEEDFGYTLEDDWSIDRELYPNVEELADDLHALGFKFFNYHNTFVDESADVFDTVVERDYCIHDPTGDCYLLDGVKFRKTTILDLTNEEAWEWAQEVYKDSLELGFDGYMADYGEWLPLDAVLSSGELGIERHNLYPVDFQRFNRELLQEQNELDGIERLFFVRSAYLRSQPLVSVVWAGDQQTDFSLGDGMPSVIPMGIGLGVTGFPYFGHDIAGYMSELTVPVTKELFFRWTSLGAFTPVMRTHHGRSAQENWNWEKDEETEAHFARWARFHMQLFPYLYGLAHRAHETGAPLFRPLALDYPDFEAGWTSTDVFMLGDRIIVAPIVEEGATARNVSLPEGQFYPLFGGQPLGGGEHRVEAEMDDIPVFVPAGALVPLLPERVDTVVSATRTEVTEAAEVGDDRVLWVYAGGASDFEEASGLSYTWTGSSTAPPTTAEYEGEGVELSSSEERTELNIVGPGTLLFDNGNTLTIRGGAADRSISVLLHH